MLAGRSRCPMYRRSTPGARRTSELLRHFAQSDPAWIRPFLNEITSGESFDSIVLPQAILVI
jgi:hypothetical protein